MQFLGLAIKLPGFISQARFGSSDHAQEESGFLGLFDTAPNGIPKVLLRNAFVCFTIICPNTCAAAHDLVDQPIVGWIARNLPRKPDNGFTESRRPFFQIERVARTDIFKLSIV